MACRTMPLRACLSRTLTRAPVAPGWRSRSDEVAFGGEELHEVTVAGCSELKTPERDRASRWKRIRNTHRVWVRSARHSWRSSGKKREKVTHSPYLARQLSAFRPVGPESQLVNAACFLVPDDGARGNHNNAQFILVPAVGSYVQQRGCARALYYLAPGVLAVGDTSGARVGGKLPSLC